MKTKTDTFEERIEKLLKEHYGILHDSDFHSEVIEEIKSEILSEKARSLAEGRSKMAFELLQVFNDYEVPLQMTAEEVREIIKTTLEETK